jgi:glycosyltransferase involved in cell wall biosynthesis
MSRHYDLIAICSDAVRLEKVGVDESVKSYPVELTRRITPFKDLRALYRLYRYFREEKPLIVHTHTPKAGLIGMLAAWLARVPHRLHTVAGLPLMEASGLKRGVLNFMERLTCQCATRVYPNSQGLKEFIVKNKFCPAKKLKVIGNGSSNGINTGYFSPVHFSPGDKKRLRGSFAIPPGDVVFCFVGRLVKDKGINELVEAFVALNRLHPRTRLLLVGSFERELDPLLPETEREIQNNPNIISTGFQTDVRPCLAIADIFVFPSYREGFPNVVMQAGAMGLPAIVTDINGCNEIITGGVNGLIIPPKDKRALQETMELLLVDSDLRTRLQRDARAMIASRYEQREVWEALLAEYKRLEEPSTIVQ